MKSFILSVLMALLGPTMAWAYCSEPSAFVSLPAAPASYDKPDVPFCLSGYSYSRTHTCSEWEISQYQDDVKEYIEKLETYMSEAARAANTALDFARNAETYAKCEAKEVADQVN